MNRWLPIALAAVSLGVGAMLYSRNAGPARAGGKTPVTGGTGPVTATRPSGVVVTRGLALGDSLTQNGGYVQVLRERAGAPWDIAAQVGASSARVLEIARTALSDPTKRYSHVVVLAGINDGRSSRTVVNLAEIYRLVRAHGAIVVAVAETPWAGYTGGVPPENWARHTAARNWVLSNGSALANVVVDSYEALEDPTRRGALRPEFAGPDRLHLNTAGQRALGELIAGRL